MRLIPRSMTALLAVAPVVYAAAAAAEAAPRLDSAAAILAQLPAPAAPRELPDDLNALPFGEVLVFPSTAQSVPDPERLKHWKAEAARHRKMGGAPAAQSWLQLEARRVAIGVAATKGESAALATAEFKRTVTFAAAVEVLPAPAHWRALLQGARAAYFRVPSAHNAAVYVFAAQLNEDSAQRIAALRALYRVWEPQLRADVAPAAADKSDAYGRRGARRGALDRDKAIAQLLGNSPDVAQQRAGLRWQLRIGHVVGNNLNVKIPDLNAQWGQSAARAFLPEVLRSTASINWDDAGTTVELARAVWLDTPASQRVPQWDLASRVPGKGGEFAQLMLREFPQPKVKSDPYGDANFARINARAALIGALVKADELKRASQLMAQWNRAGFIDEIFYLNYYDVAATPAQAAARLDWLGQTLALYPQLDWWDTYFYAAMQAGQAERALQFVRALTRRADYDGRPARQRAGLQRVGAKLALAQGQVQSGGDELARAIEAAMDARPAEVGAYGWEMEQSARVTALLLLTRVAPNVGWLRVARAGAQQVFALPIERGDSESQSRARTDIALLLDAQKQRVFAGHLLSSALLRGAAPPEKQDRWAGTPSVKAYLYGLATIYFRADRPDDVLTLLRGARGWQSGQLTPLLDYHGQSSWDNDSDPDLKARPKLGFIAAWALAQTGQREQAATVLRALLERSGGDDGAYQLLVQLQGKRALPFLQTLAQRDPYEERPLIWQANLARRGDDFQAAEKLARRAIAVDPSDGEQPRGDRLRAYAELGAALQGQNRAAEAARLREAVAAIRLAEDADRWRIAGVMPQAIALYARSARVFDNAYCVQSRLAVALANQGDFERAATHFERAYQLMPNSFGRLESHCFGCEGVFDNPKSQPIAKRVFLQLEKAQPSNPRVAYLSGYWRQMAGQPAEATRDFERAVKLDPLYLSAWKQLQNSSASLAPLQRDAATLAVLKLDPTGQHNSGNPPFQIERDYRGLWQVTAAALPRRNSELLAGFALPRSSPTAQDDTPRGWNAVTSPANAIARQGFVARLSEIME